VHPEGNGYGRFCELYGRWRRKQDVVLRQEHKPGEKGFVDWAGATGTGTQITALASQIDKIPQVIKAYRMSGDTCFLAIVVAESTEHLEKLLNAMSAYVQASTSIVVSTPLAYRSLGPSAFQSG
jgi:DNA-binding Lrp family transcriptional regulator